MSKTRRFPERHKLSTWINPESHSDEETEAAAGDIDFSSPGTPINLTFRTMSRRRISRKQS